MTNRDNDLVELLQAKAADLLTDSEAKDRLRQIRPEWFPTNEAGAIRVAELEGEWVARPIPETRQWAVRRRKGGGWVAMFGSSDHIWNREMAEDLAEEMNNGGCEEPR